MADDIKVHPIQVRRVPHKPDCISAVVALRAYEVYARVHGEQKEMITGNCRAGFGIGEIVAFLYARSFPDTEWRKRIDEALTGMKGL